jgi:hypothetical protein
MVAKRSPRTPERLAAPGRRLWRSILSAYDLSPGELALLEQACRSVDLLARIDDQLAREDLTVPGSRGQQRCHPLAYLVIDQRKVLESLMNALALPMPNEVEGKRRSPQAAAAAQARWRDRRTS